MSQPPLHTATRPLSAASRSVAPLTLLSSSGLPVSLCPLLWQAPLPAQFYPMVAALRLQDEVDSTLSPASSSSSSRRLTVVTSHTCAASVPQPGKLELLIHRHLNQDDGRGLAEGVADNSRQDITLTFSLQSIDRLQPGLPISAAHFDDELSFNRHLLHIQHPTLTFILQRSNNIEPPAGFQEFTSVAAHSASLLPRIADWTATQWALVEPMTQPLPSTVHLHTLMARDAVTDEVALRLQHVGVDITQESDAPSAAAASAQSTASIDLTQHFPPSVRLSEMRRVGITLNHRRPWTGLTVHQHSGEVDADSLHPGWTFRADESPDVMDTLLLRAFLAGRQRTAVGGENQNSQEQGVFISEAALRGEQEKRRLDEEQQRQQRQSEVGAGRRVLHSTDTAYAYAAEANVSESAVSVAAVAMHRRLLVSSQPWSSLSLPVVRISSNQLQAFILHIESDDDEAKQREDRDPHPGVVRPPVRQADTETSVDSNREVVLLPVQWTQPSQSPVSNEAHGGGVSPVDESDSVIPSRVEYLLILVVCVLAVSFFALALGLIPAKAIVRVCQQCVGNVPSGPQPQQHSNGRNGGTVTSTAANSSIPSRLYSLLYAIEHWAGRMTHRMRAYVLHARYGRQRVTTAV